MKEQLNRLEMMGRVKTGRAEDHICPTCFSSIVINK